MSILDNLIEAAWTTLVQAWGLDKPHRPTILSPIELTTLDIRKTLIHTWGLDNPLLIKITTPNIRNSPSTLDNLFRRQAGSKLGGIMYCLGSRKYTWHPTWYSETCVNPPHQSCNRSADTLPLVVGLPNWQVISNLLIFEYLYLLVGS